MDVLLNNQIPLLGNMDADMIKQLVTEVCSVVIKQNDTYKTAKYLHLRNWCITFSELFKENREERLPFFLEILSEEDCWEKTTAIHRIKLNRRKAAKKMVQQQNSRGTFNPLNLKARYLVACWCCLEGDIRTLFQEFKEVERVDENIFYRLLIRVYSSEPLAIYWTCIMSGYFSDIMLQRHNLYEYGLKQVFISKAVCVEAIEYFWNKINSLSDDQLNSQLKKAILIKTAVTVAGDNFRKHPEITEFLLTEMDPDWYPEVLQSQRRNQIYGSLLCLKFNLCFDLYQKLFEHLKPHDVPFDLYHDVLRFSGMTEYSELYSIGARQLFMHVWMKKGFDSHRSDVLRREMIQDGQLIVSLRKKKYFAELCAILSKAHSYEHNTLYWTNLTDIVPKNGDEYSLDVLKYINTSARNFDS